jgi:hypothetical protein
MRIQTLTPRIGHRNSPLATMSDLVLSLAPGSGKNNVVRRSTVIINDGIRDELFRELPLGRLREATRGRGPFTIGRHFALLSPSLFLVCINREMRKWARVWHMRGRAPVLISQSTRMAVRLRSTVNADLDQIRPMWVRQIPAQTFAKEWRPLWLFF